jgi:hypothetical protein
MDYNFYVAQSGGTSNAANGPLYEQQMYETYVRYFDGNYSGNRGPIHIGHHFSQWNGGAYWRAMKRFADYACGKPEVRCITYKEYADYLDSLTPETLASYRRGEFKKDATAILGSLATSQPGALALVDPGNLSLSVNATASGFQATLKDDALGALARSVKVRWELNGKRIGSGPAIELGAIHETGILSVSAGTRGHGEILRQSFTLTQPDSDTLELGSEALEERALVGDLPEAHQD